MESSTSAAAASSSDSSPLPAHLSWFQEDPRPSRGLPGHSAVKQRVPVGGRHRAESCPREHARRIPLTPAHTGECCEWEPQFV
ncbi:unnamed protein product [Vitrella brassicaformis CCMP3155]|uniref:Uncharacterized protein n=1 Tax=Vitrella brassicaformis (strain CCMP3155) TaxID=1169540 RepID=A0A0G4FIE8_VITBC|nr:unnamed protein product [Vitrella brassicaformis CCMP3155]|eukprot:CEM13285.1 unnamed protein product [Vitrella brassicaformis CCMP3155]